MRSFGDVFEHYVRSNLLATQRVFEAAAAAGVRVVFASSSSIYGDAESYPTPEDASRARSRPYGITKLGCEHLARAYAQSFGLDVVVLRYFTVYGPRQRPDMAFARIVDALARGASFELYGDGLQSRSFTYVGDAVDATIAAMERGDRWRLQRRRRGRRRRCGTRSRPLERVSGRKLDLVERPPRPGDVKPHLRRHEQDRARPRLACGDVARRRLGGPVGMGLG